MPSGMARAYIGLGSSMGDRKATLQGAARSIAATLAGGTPGFVRCSSVFETDPAAPPATQTFLNAAMVIETKSTAVELLAGLQAIEIEYGRVRDLRWEDRTLDLDLLAMVDDDGRSLEVGQDGLELPHPQAHLRDFVLAPLCELNGELQLAGRSCREHLTGLPQNARTLRARLDFELLGLGDRPKCD